LELFDFRREYLSGGLRCKDLKQDPFVQFELWLNQLLALDTMDPTAMTLATVDSQGQPSQRIVLLKQFDGSGFIFFTNKNSHKAIDIKNNPQAGLHFPWHQVDRQVNIQGTIEDISQKDSEQYFQSRPRESKIAAWASEQSQVLTSREQLLAEYERRQKEFPDEVPMPDFWGGYRLVPSTIEFWQGGEFRLHDRFVYRRENSVEGQTNWSIQRLSP
jgi:pyridoxamine 5'-phosphate oxidase